MTKCAACQRDNRAIAKFCKGCGAEIIANVPVDQLDSMVGMEGLRKTLADIRKTTEGMRANQRDPKRPLSMLIIGESGTGKTRLADIIAAELFDQKLLSKSKPQILNGLSLPPAHDDGLRKAVNAAKGSLLFIDNAHNLVNADGTAKPELQQIMSCMEEPAVEPIMVFAGLPHGLNEFVQLRANGSLIARFYKVLQLPDYVPEELRDICLKKLTEDGFVVSDAVSQQLLMRMRYLYRMNKVGKEVVLTMNGTLARSEAKQIEEAYYARQGTAMQLQVQDIVGKVDRIKSIDEILAELDGFVGMANIKKEVRDLHREIEFARSRAQQLNKPFRASESCAHFMITGNPGTGKTSVARALGEVFEALGVLSSGHVVEVDRSGLVGQYVGETPQKVVAACKRAEGGILFIDEAYGLINGDNDTFGKEAIDTLLKRMEDDRGKYVVIAAGYQDQMDDFLKSNPGLASRFTKTFHLNDYSPQELADIFALIAKGNGFKLGHDAHGSIQDFFESRCRRKTKDFANAREARNLFGEVKRALDARLCEEAQTGQPDPEALLTILPKDVPSAGEASQEKLNASMQELNALIGLAGVKQAVSTLQRALERDRLMGNKKPIARHFVFTGNPGTGKTTVARLLAKVFHGLGLLPTDRLVEVDRSKLVGQYLGQTAPKVNDACDKAMGGILFVDEAYTLSSGDGDAFGKEAIDTLLKRMEDDRGKYVVIAAGYEKQMQGFLDSNPGLRSRFSDTIDFEDYKPEEMVEIFLSMCRSEGITLGTEAQNALHKHMQRVYARRDKNFANARTVRQIFDRVKGANSDRVMHQADLDDEARKQACSEFTVADFGEEQAQSASGDVLTQVMAQLNGLIGLESVKSTVKRLQTSLLRERYLGNSAPLSKHFVFTGNPGTGKTTVARLLAQVFHGLGLLPTDNLVEVDRSGLVGKYQGETPGIVNKVVDAAMGGVLFIDEAYALLPPGATNDPGMEAVNTLLKRMEDDRGKFVVIAAGYDKEMGVFLDSNSGLRSRFSDTVVFEDYRPAEMQAIFLSMCSKAGMELAEGFEEALRSKLEQIYAKRDKNFANARTVRQLYDKVGEACSERVMQLGLKSEEEIAQAMRRFEVADLGGASDTGTNAPAVVLEESMGKLQAITGLKGVKDAVERLRSTLERESLMGSTKGLARHFIFTGNPGTGKTTVARLLAKVFYGMGLLPTDKLVEVDRSQLVGQYLGQTAPKVNAACDQALGGVLFIDEAYSLAGDSFGKEAIDTLLKRMEDDRGKFVVIAAGYEKEMQQFLDSNTGLRSRFSDTIDFEDYVPQDMVQIFLGMCKADGIRCEEGFEGELLEQMQQIWTQRDQNFANARTVRQFYDRVGEACGMRVIASDMSMEEKKQAVRVLKVEDLGVTQ